MTVWAGRGGLLMNNGSGNARLHSALLVSLTGVLVWSVIRPHDLFTWILEALPAIVGVLVLLLTYYKRFRLTNLAYVLIWIHCIILLVGAHYTYAMMPAFNWLKDTFDLSRNYYDRVGHVAQGFIPAILAREVLLRTSPLKKGKWLFFIVVCICLAISAFYELLEWLVAVVTGTAADMFLGTQGDVWDTQKDMALCLLAAIVALITLGPVHDRAVDKIGDKTE
jgi:putative membrane protein